MTKKNQMLKSNVVDTEGRVWRRYAIPEGVTLANGESKEKIDEEIRKSKQRKIKLAKPKRKQE